MARPRQWSDIDPEWLTQFLLQQGWEDRFDLSSETLRTEVAEALDGGDWRTLRLAWKRQASQDEFSEEAAQEESAPVGATTSVVPEVAKAPVKPASVMEAAAPVATPTVDEAAEQLEGLRRRALQDWDAFAELVRLPQRHLNAFRKQSTTPLRHLQAVAELQPAPPLPPSGGAVIDIALRGLHAYRNHCHQRGVRPSLDHAKRTMTALRTLPETTLEEAWKQLIA